MGDITALNQTKEDLWNIYISPPLLELTRFLHRNISIKGAREIIFFPKASHMKEYPELVDQISKTSSTAQFHRPIEMAILNILDLKHIHKWDLMQEFINANGLSVLAKLIVDEHDMIRGTALYPFNIYRITVKKHADLLCYP
jgi:hypothetical protein